MRRTVALLALAVSMGAAPATRPASADPAPGGFMSSNVSWVATLATDAGGVSAAVRTVEGQRRFYASTLKGLTIYDVTNPALPLPLGHLPLPNWQNENVQVSADGTTVLIANDVLPVSYLIDTSLVHAPLIVARIPGAEHTIACVDDACRWAWGVSGAIYDLRDRENPAIHQRRWDAGLNLGQRAHAFNRDAAGLIMTDTNPRYLLDPRGRPTRPRVLAVGPVPGEPRLAYQHNNVRTRAKAWTPRAEGDNAKRLRAGELFLANGETNFTGTCGPGSGPFATWSMRDFDAGEPMKPLHVFRPINGDYLDGDPAVNVLGCSGHWFTFRKGIVAAAWYENGTRFLDINPRTGEIEEVGYFQPVVGAAGAAYWIDDEYVYVMDYERGIDILRFDRAGPIASRAEIEASWLAALDLPASPPAEAERFICALSATAA